METQQTDNDTANTDWKKQARQWEAEAKRVAQESNADIEQQIAKLETERATRAAEDEARIQHLERQIADLAQQALAYRISGEYGIDETDMHLFLSDGDEETLRARAARLANTSGNRSPRRTPTQPTSTDRKHVHDVFGHGTLGL